MTVLNENLNYVHLNIALAIFLVVLVNIVIAIEVNQKARYAEFIVYSAYAICAVLSTVAYLAFSWYIAILICLLISDLMSKWVAKELVLASEEEKNGGYGLKKQIRKKQIEDFTQKASPYDLMKVKQFGEKPIKFSRPLFIVLTNVVSLMIIIVYDAVL